MYANDWIARGGHNKGDPDAQDRESLKNSSLEVVERIKEKFDRLLLKKPETLEFMLVGRSPPD